MCLTTSAHLPHCDGTAGVTSASIASRHEWAYPGCTSRVMCTLGHVWATLHMFHVHFLGDSPSAFMGATVSQEKRRAGSPSAPRRSELSIGAASCTV